MPLDYHVRPIAPNDHAFLREMLYQAIYVLPGAPQPDRALLNTPAFTKYVDDWGQADDSGFLAVTVPDQYPIGAAWLRRLTQLNPGYGYVDDQTPELTIAVDPQYRGHGIGTQLLTQLLTAASQRYAALSLSVDPINPALSLYQRLGFRVVATSGTSLTLRLDFAPPATISTNA